MRHKDQAGKAEHNQRKRKIIVCEERVFKEMSMTFLFGKLIVHKALMKGNLDSKAISRNI